MSLYRIAMVVFLVATGLVFLFTMNRTAEIVAGVAALVAAGLILTEGMDIKTGA